MKALITGAGGFTGSYLIPLLRAEGITMKALTSQPLPGVRCHSPEWQASHALARVIERVAPDFVFHLAGSRNPKSANVNVDYARNLFAAMSEAEIRVPTLVVGSAAEYGNVAEKDLPITETQPAEPVSEYGISKLLQTTAAQAAFRNGIPAVTARLFNVIGPGVPATLVVGRYVEQVGQVLRAERQTIVMGDTRPARDFIDAGDCAKIFLKLVRTPKAAGQVVNVCRGRAVPVRNVLKRLGELCGVRDEVKTDPAIKGGSDVMVSYGSNAKLLSLIGDFDFTELDETLGKIAERLLAHSLPARRKSAF